VKKISLILNIVLLAGLLVLYYLHFTSKTADSSFTLTGGGNANIVYVNTDTLWEKYSYVADKKIELELYNKELEDQYKNTMTAFEREYNQLESDFNEYIQKASANSFTLAEQKSKESQFEKRKQILAQKQNEILTLEQELANKLMQRQTAVNTMIQDSIINYLERFNNKHQFTYIMGYTRTSGHIMLANDSLDITKPILEGLNKEYESFKGKEE
jgi:outer membrane protein